MNAVQEIKQRHDMGILLRAIAPAARKRQEARRQKKMGKSRINAALARRGIPFRVVCRARCIAFAAGANSGGMCQQ